MRLGLADHFGWAIAVTATDDHRVVDRRRLELLEPGVAAAPVHHEGKPLDDAGVLALIAEVRASIRRAATAAFDELQADLSQPIRSVSLRTWPPDFPQDIAVQRQVPWEARADAIMYREELAQLAGSRGWEVWRYDAKGVEAAAAQRLGARAEEVLHGPRATLGPPWAKDHRVALAATIVGG